MKLEAVHHAVWHRPDNTLADVTPKVDGEQRILFLPDPARPFDFTNSVAWGNKNFMKMKVPKPVAKMMMADTRGFAVVSIDEVNKYLHDQGLQPVGKVCNIPTPTLSRGIYQKQNGLI